MDASVDYFDAATALDDLLFEADASHRTPATVAPSLPERFVGYVLRVYFNIRNAIVVMSVITVVGKQTSLQDHLVLDSTRYPGSVNPLSRAVTSSPPAGWS